MTKARYISRLTRDSLALVLAGGRGTRLHELTDWRAKPALHFGGKFRIIDFPLSNCVNSGIRRIGVLTQYNAHSLIRHLQRAWGGFRRELGEFVDVLPASQRTTESWYAGTADAIYQNLDIIRRFNPKYVIVLAGDHVYKMDYGPMIAFHLERRADMTISCISVPSERGSNLGLLLMDQQQRITGFAEKPADVTPWTNNNTCIASMGNYVFNTEFLFEQLIQDADDPDSGHDFGKDIIPKLIENDRVFGFEFASEEDSYWRDVGTLDSFWSANMELIDVTPPLNLYDNDWPLLTYQSQLPPAKFVFDYDHCRGMAINSVVAGGCIVSGAMVKESVLFSKVTIEQGTEVMRSVIFPNVHIGKNCRITNAIIDKHTRIPDNTIIGEDIEMDKGYCRITDQGIRLVTPSMLGQTVHYQR